MNNSQVPPSIRVRTSTTYPVGERDSQFWQIATEVPVALIYNGKPHAVMMATPQDLVDFSIGFSLSEEVVTSHAAIEEIYIEHDAEGFRIFISIDENQIGPGYTQTRTIAGRTSCGLCGLAELKDAVRVSANQVVAVDIPDPAIITKSLHAFSDAQAMHQTNRSVHGAAFCSMDGEILLIREDIGRHNALDKLLGALSSSGLSRNGYLVMSSRCSFELVKKSIVFGLSGLVTISAPTSLALDIAKKANMFLACQQGPNSVTFF
ncbi:MAG: formate dehydrogenase accessory sulfurtransferase FdhD [Methylocystaceae bacterium]|nr:formate dehydrogenase accessory sulfurtransferase FdhD [Methylocystaceae bacterium]